MSDQTCEKCRQNKPLSEFQRRRQIYKKIKNSDKEWYYYSICKACNKDKKSDQDRKYREEHKAEKAAKDKEYRENNKDKLSEQAKERYVTNKDAICGRMSVYYKNKMANDPVFVEKERIRSTEKAKKSKPARNKQRQSRRKLDPSYRLRTIVSKSVWGALLKNGGSKNGDSSIKRLPYSMDDLRAHLESLFEPWMNWKNQGSYKVSEWIDNDQSTWRWNIDHIIPQSDLPYTSMEDDNFKTCWALSNLRPLSAKQNILEGTSRKRHAK